MEELPAMKQAGLRGGLLRMAIIVTLLAASGGAQVSAPNTPLPEQYREPFTQSWPIRLRQHRQIQAYAERLPPVTRQPMRPTFEPDTTSVAAYEQSLQPARDFLRQFFGVPPGARAGRMTKFEQVGEDQHCQVFRVWVEVIDGVEAYGLYLLPKQRGAKAPLLIAQHGGGGNPEAICDLDTRDNYRGFGPEAVKRGFSVWAPGLAMRCDYCGDPEIPAANREQLDQQLKRGGTSIIGLELHAIIESTRALIQARPEIDAERVGMTGLSWGGFYTMYVTAVSPFIKAAAPSAYFKDYDDILARAKEGKARSPDREVATGLSHAQAIGLICPRPCLVQMGEKDPVVPIAGARQESERAADLYKKLGVADQYEFQVHAGGHVYDTKAVLDFFERRL